MPASKRVLSQRGYALIMTLVGVAVLSALAARATLMYADEVKRNRQRQLLRVGEVYVAAIASYYEASPGGSKQFPKALDDLIEDRRFLGTRRHLRKIFWDPVLVTRDWGLVQAPDGGIQGIFSTSNQALLVSPPASGTVGELRQRVSDVRFIYVPPH